MNFFILSISFFTLLMLNPFAGAAAPAPENTIPFISSSTSNHIIIFGGNNWGNVLKSKGKVLVNAIVYDVLQQVHRKYSFNTSVTVQSMRTNGLVVDISVQQTLFPGVSDARLQHVWPPDETNSMIAQGKFTETKNLYFGEDKPTLIAVQLPEMHADINECASTCQRVFVVSVVIVGLMTVTLLVVFFWLIYLYCFMKRQPKEPRPCVTSHSQSSNSGEPWEQNENNNAAR